MSINSALRQPVRGAIRKVTGAYPLLSGCGTIAQTKFLARLLAADPELKIVRLTSGEQIIVPANDFVGRSVYYFGDLDPKVSWVCDRILRRGDTALDIGANIGLVALRMAGRVGPTGLVHAFEPQPNLASLVERSAVLNAFGHLHVHNIGLGSETGTLQLYVPDVNAGAASLVRTDGAGRAIDVRVEQSGPCFEQLGLGPIRFIKIDVEGFEHQVFAGAFDYLSRAPADAILFESNDHTTDFIDQPLTKTLTDLGYCFVEIKKTLIHMDLRRIDLANAQPQYGNDLLAIHNGPRAAELLATLGVK